MAQTSPTPWALYHVALRKVAIRGKNLQQTLSNNTRFSVMRRLGYMQARCRISDGLKVNIFLTLSEDISIQRLIRDFESRPPV